MRFTVTKREFPRGQFTWWIEDSNPYGRIRGPFLNEGEAQRHLSDPYEQELYANEGA